jgi:pimeloyl-ACP methyl ester carboxylesterase
VLSGGFAANLLPRWKALAAHASRLAGGPLYRRGVRRFHAFQLASRFDASAPMPHTRDDYRRLFIDNTPRSSYTARVTSVTRFDIGDRLHRVTVPALVLTPEDDRIVGRHAADEMLRGMPHSREIVAWTGHMFRFTHPDQYAATITDFLRSDVVAYDPTAA